MTTMIAAEIKKVWLWPLFCFVINATIFMFVHGRLLHWLFGTMAASCAFSTIITWIDTRHPLQEYGVEKAIQQLERDRPKLRSNQ